jgi:integrase
LHPWDYCRHNPLGNEKSKSKECCKRLSGRLRVRFGWRARRLYPKLKAWVIEQSEEYSKDSVGLQIAVLRTMLQEAVNEGILPVNPVMKLGKFYRSARRVKEKVDPFTIEELHRIEAKCKEKFPEHYSFILCMARTGMRIGEATAIHWHDIDFSKNYIIVRRNIPHHRQVETTKTEASQRKVDMSPELAADLKVQRTEQKKKAMDDGKTFELCSDS